MKKILLSLFLAGAFTGSATAAPDDITAPIITNVFTTSVSESSSSLRSVRVGRSATTSLPSVIFNEGDDNAPVVLAMSSGKLTYNGVALATDTFVGTDIAVTQDLTVGRDAAITRNATVGGTLGVTGALSGSTLGLSGASTLLGAVEMGAENTQSTMTAAGVLTVHASVAAPAITGSTSVTSPLMVSTGPHRLYSRSQAQILAITPGAVGEELFCNDCTPKKVVVSTGTSAGNFAAVDGGVLQ